MSRLASMALAGAALVLGTATAIAHHSNQMFDTEKVITLEGTIKEFQYTQPHSWIQVLVGEKGNQVEWSVETSSPSMLQRAGIRKSSLRFGEKVSITIHPLKDGRPGGLFVSLKKADGTVLSFKTAPGTLSVTK